MNPESTVSPSAILLRCREVAVLVGVDESTVKKWTRTGLLKPVRIGGATRYRRSDIEALADSTCGNGPGGNDVSRAGNAADEKEGAGAADRPSV